MLCMQVLEEILNIFNSSKEHINFIAQWDVGGRLDIIHVQK